MGIKGDKHTSDSQLASDLFIEKIGSIDGVTSKKMFGGHGIFHEGKMFAIIDSNGQEFLKTDEELSIEFSQLGSNRHGKMPYHSIPIQVLDSQKLLYKYVKRSIELSK